YKRKDPDENDDDGIMRFLRNSGRQRLEYTSGSVSLVVPPSAAAVRSKPADDIVIDHAGGCEGAQGGGGESGVLPLIDARRGPARQDADRHVLGPRGSRPSGRRPGPRLARLLCRSHRRPGRPRRMAPGSPRTVRDQGGRLPAYVHAYARTTVPADAAPAVRARVPVHVADRCLGQGY